MMDDANVIDTPQINSQLNRACLFFQYPKILPATAAQSTFSNSSFTSSTDVSRAATPIRLTPHEVANAAKMLRRIDDMKGIERFSTK